MPLKSDIRNRWLERISKHQTIDSNIVYFHVCERHFNVDEFIQKRGKSALKNDAVPSIFDEAPNVTDTLSSGHQKKLRRRYCKIKYCSNETGTSDKEVSFFW